MPFVNFTGKICLDHSQYQVLAVRKLRKVQYLFAIITVAPSVSSKHWWVKRNTTVQAPLPASLEDTNRSSVEAVALSQPVNKKPLSGKMKLPARTGK